MPLKTQCIIFTAISRDLLQFGFIDYSSQFCCHLNDCAALHNALCRSGHWSSWVWEVDLLLGVAATRCSCRPQYASLQPGSSCRKIPAARSDGSDAEHRHTRPHQFGRSHGRLAVGPKWRLGVLLRVSTTSKAVTTNFGLKLPGFYFACLLIQRYLLQNIDWLQEALGDFEDDYLLIDCPGQIELYTHIPIMPRLIAALQQANIRPCALYLLESQFMEDKSKFFAGVLSAMSCMINLEVPHVNILSKMDLVKSGRGGSAKMRKDVDRFLETDPLLLREEGLSRTNPRFQALNEAIVQLVSQTSGLLSGVSGLLSGVFPIFKVCLDYPQIEDFNMVQFLPLDITDEDSVELILSHIDNAIQYGEAEVGILSTPYMILTSGITLTGTERTERHGCRRF